MKTSRLIRGSVIGRRKLGSGSCFPYLCFFTFQNILNNFSLLPQYGSPGDS